MHFKIPTTTALPTLNQNQSHENSRVHSFSFLNQQQYTSTNQRADDCHLIKIAELVNTKTLNYGSRYQYL